MEQINDSKNEDDIKRLPSNFDAHDKGLSTRTTDKTKKEI